MDEFATIELVNLRSLTEDGSGIHIFATKSSADWIMLDVKLEGSNSSAQFACEITPGDLKAFVDELEKVNSDLKGCAILETPTEEIELSMAVSDPRKGRFIVGGVLRSFSPANLDIRTTDVPMRLTKSLAGMLLTFDGIETDQTYVSEFAFNSRKVISVMAMK